MSKSNGWSNFQLCFKIDSLPTDHPPFLPVVNVLTGLGTLSLTDRNATIIQMLERSSAKVMPGPSGLSFLTDVRTEFQ